MVSLDNDGNFKRSAVQDSIAKEQILAKYVQLTCIKPCKFIRFHFWQRFVPDLKGLNSWKSKGYETFQSEQKWNNI